MTSSSMSIQVKPLEWTQKAPPGREHEPFVYWAAGLGGHYSAEPDGLLWMAGDEFTWQQHPTQAAAKAAAQADYEARIRSALHPTPTPVSASVESEIIALLREVRTWIGDGENADDLGREIWTDAYADIIDRVDDVLARSPAVEGK